MTKRTIYRSIALALIIILAGVLFWIGKGHTLLLDNKDLTINGKTYPALSSVKVTVNQQESVQVRAGTRKMPKNMVAGPWHRITVDVLENDQVVRTIEKKFSLPLADMFVLNIPALVADDPNWIQIFTPENK